MRARRRPTGPGRQRRVVQRPDGGTRRGPRRRRRGRRLAEAAECRPRDSSEREHGRLPPQDLRGRDRRHRHRLDLDVGAGLISVDLQEHVADAQGRPLVDGRRRPRPPPRRPSSRDDHRRRRGVSERRIPAGGEWVVETMGLEPTTPCLQSRCSSQLSYVPTKVARIGGEVNRLRRTTAPGSRISRHAFSASCTCRVPGRHGRGPAVRRASGRAGALTPVGHPELVSDRDRGRECPVL